MTATSGRMNWRIAGWRQLNFELQKRLSRQGRQARQEREMMSVSSGKTETDWKYYFVKHLF
jgi:hypothetical protein